MNASSNTPLTNLQQSNMMGRIFVFKIIFLVGYHILDLYYRPAMHIIDGLDSDQAIHHICIHVSAMRGGDDETRGEDRCRTRKIALIVFKVE